MKSLAVVAGAIHGLSLSVAYGGPVFAKVGLKRALRRMGTKDERRAVMQNAWSQFSKVNVPAHVGFTASWLVLRTMLGQVKLDRSTKNLLIAKDALIAGALITGVAATITGQALKRAQRASAKHAAGASAAKPSEAAGSTTRERSGHEAAASVTRERAAHKAKTAGGAKKQYKKLLRLERKLGRANMAFLAGAIIISPAIGMGIFRSQRMGLLGRLFNR